MTFKYRKKKIISLPIILVTIFLSAIFLSSCKKSSGTKDPIAISAQAESIGFILNSSNDNADYIYLDFNYNGVKYSVSTGRVDQGNQNGTFMIANTNLIATNSTLSEETSGTDVITVSNPSSNTITLSIDKFIFVYGTSGPVDVKDFNKITLSISPATKFTVTGFSSNPYDDTWANTYKSDLPGFTNLMSSIASQINTNTPFVISVSK